MSVVVTAGNAAYTSDTNLQWIPLQNTISILKAQNCPITAAIQFGNAVFAKNTRSLKVAPRKESSDQEVLYWKTGEKLPRKTTVATANVPASDISFSVATGTGPYFVADDVIVCGRTQEQMHVESVSGAVLYVQRAPTINNCLTGQKPQAAMVAGDVIARTGTSKKEGGSASTGRVVNVNPFQNLMQFMDKVFGVTEVADTTKLHGGSLLTAEEMKAVIDLSLDIEQSVVMGQPSNQVAGDGSMRSKMCGGIRWIEAYGVVVPVGGALTRPVWEDWLSEMIAIDNEKRIIPCSRKTLAYIDSWADGRQIFTTSDVSSLGVNVTEYKSTLGVFQLFHHPLLDDEICPISAFAFNPSYWTLVEKIPFAMKREVQDRKAYTHENLIRGEISLKVEFPNTMGALTGVV